LALELRAWLGAGGSTFCFLARPIAFLALGEALVPAFVDGADCPQAQSCSFRSGNIQRDRQGISGPNARIGENAVRELGAVGDRHPGRSEIEPGGDAAHRIAAGQPRHVTGDNPRIIGAGIIVRECFATISIAQQPVQIGDAQRGEHDRASATFAFFRSLSGQMLSPHFEQTNFTL